MVLKAQQQGCSAGHKVLDGAGDHGTAAWLRCSWLLAAGMLLLAAGMLLGTPGWSGSTYIVLKTPLDLHHNHAKAGR